MRRTNPWACCAASALMCSGRILSIEILAAAFVALCLRKRSPAFLGRAHGGRLRSVCAAEAEPFGLHRTKFGGVAACLGERRARQFRRFHGSGLGADRTAHTHLT